MPINANEQGKKPSIHITEEDAENAEALGKGNNSPSSVYTEALKDSTTLENLRQEKKQELQRKLNEIIDTAEKWEIDDLRFDI